ncbi:MAG: hypothetical protein N2Z20_02245 [Elusimicrobiales bacterium]|nr:hypothetical protein [Elusimicrobiales bacterium]
MMSYLKGKVIKINKSSIVVENFGVGYEIIMTENDITKLTIGLEIEIFIITSFSMYEGIKLYGFLNEEEKELFDILKNSIPNTGNTKAIEYLNKIQKSVSNFRKAVLKGDEKLLKEIFGFTSKTSKKIINFLRDKIKDELSEHDQIIFESYSKNYDTAINALVNLGYKMTDVKSTVSQVISENKDKNMTLEDIIKVSLKILSKR